MPEPEKYSPLRRNLVRTLNGSLKYVKASDTVRKFAQVLRSEPDRVDATDHNLVKLSKLVGAMVCYFNAALDGAFVRTRRDQLPGFCDRFADLIDDLRKRPGLLEYDPGFRNLAKLLRALRAYARDMGINLLRVNLKDY